MALATSVLDDAVAWITFPLLIAVTCLGMGLLAERVTGVTLPGTLLLPAGFCLSIVVVLPGYTLGASGVLGAVLLAVGTAAGLLLSRRHLRGRIQPGAVGVAAAAVFALFLAPIVLSGGWTWGGYNFLNDTAVQLMLTERLQEAGATLVEGSPSTRSESIRIYLESNYPLGVHGHLASLITLLHVGVDVVYQGYLAMLAVIATLALARLGWRAGLESRAAAAAAAVAVGSNLFYQYALQGSVKEIAALTAFVTAGALGRELLDSEHPLGMVALFAVAGAAMVSVFSAAAAPYVVLLAALLIVSAFVAPRAVALRRRLLPAAAVGGSVLVVAALPTLVSALAFYRVASATLAPESQATSVLGQLARPLEAVQLAGIWLAGNYSMAIASPSLNLITHVLSWLVLALLAGGLVVQLRRREPAVALVALAALGAAVLIAPRASAYADAKLLAVASPVVLFGALCTALSPAPRWRIPRLVAAVAITLGVVWSDAYAYHAVRLAPVERLQALQDAAEHTRGRGLVLLNELEEFAKYYGRNTQLNVGFEAITPKQARPFGGGYHLDLDQLEPGYVQEFATILTRRGADVSRPPADYAHTYANRYYEVWERRAGPHVLSHFPLQAANLGAATPSCATVRRLGSDAPAGSWLVAASAPEVVALDVVGAPDRPAGWSIPQAPLGVVSPATPGAVRGARRIAGGEYAVWIRASSGRPLIARVDGREVGRPQGMNTHGQWLRAGSVRLTPGRHELELERPGGSLAPGDGATGLLGPLELVRQSRRELTWVRPGQARELCGRRLDWIEVARR